MFRTRLKSMCRAAAVIVSLSATAVPAQGIGAGYAGSSTAESGAADRQAPYRSPATLDRAVERCKSQRGVDCDSPGGQREWVQQERPISRQEQINAAAARRHREQCARNRSSPGC